MRAAQIGAKASGWTRVVLVLFRQQRVHGVVVVVLVVVAHTLASRQLQVSIRLLLGSLHGGTGSGALDPSPCMMNGWAGAPQNQIANRQTQDRHEVRALRTRLVRVDARQVALVDPGVQLLSRHCENKKEKTFRAPFPPVMRHRPLLTPASAAIEPACMNQCG